MNHLMALDSTASAQGSGLSMIAMLLVYAVFIVALYFIFFRPQSKTDSIVIETGSDKAKLRVKRWAIGSVDTVHEDDQN